MTDRSEITARKRRPEARPSEILEAALDLFTERGFNATRLEDVASRAGLSKAAIYLYFKDKTSLLVALVQATAGANIEIAAQMIAQHQGPVAPLLPRLLAFMAGRIEGTRMPDLMKLVISESRAHPGVGRFYLDNVIGKALPLFQSLIERGIVRPGSRVAQYAVRAGRLSLARRLIARYLALPQLSPAFVAMKLGISVRHLHVLFEQASMSFSHTVTALRIERSRELLHEAPKMTVAAIASASGFDSLATFYRVFRGLQGVTPGDFREAPIEETA